MKQITNNFLLFAVFVFSSFYSNALTKADGNPNELIVAFEKLNDKQLTYFDELITQIPGVKNTGYCQRLKIYIFEYDSSIYRNDEAALNAIAVQTKKFIPIQKVGTSSQDILKSCN